MSGAQLCALLLIAVASFAISYLGAAVGMVLGHFRVILFSYVLGSPAAGAATSMLVSTVTAFGGAVEHARGQRVQVGPLLLMGIPSAFAAFVAAHYAGRIDPLVLKLGIVGATIFAAVDLLREHHTHVTGRVLAPPDRLQQLKGLGTQIAIGAGLGAISGLVGLLLGSLRLPAMVRLGVRPASAIGTNMAIGALTGLSGGVAALVGGRVSVVAFLVVGPLSLLGAHYGAKKTGQFSATKLKRWMSAALGVTAVVVLADVWLSRVA